jgi:hypothetical protein
VELSSYSLSVVTTVLSTVIIGIRILKVSRMPGASRQPKTAMEIVVESAVLYSLSASVYILVVAFAKASALTYQIYVQLFFDYMAVESHPSPHSSSSPNSPSQNFAPALIMLRVVLGRARPDIEWSGRISDLQFSSGRSRQREIEGAVSTILTVPRSQGREEVDLEANGEPKTDSLDGEKGVGGKGEGQAGM